MSRSSSSPRLINQGSPHPTKEAHTTNGSLDPSSSSSSSQLGPLTDPGRSFHLYPNDRFPSPSRNGVVYDIHNSTEHSNANLSSNGNRDFVKDFSPFFFQELLPLFLKGEYSAVFDTSLKFIFSYFNMNNPTPTVGNQGYNCYNNQITSTMSITRPCCFISTSHRCQSER